MNMEKININSMDYRKLSKEDKLKVVRFKINKLLSDTSSSKAYEYYNGKKVGVPKDKLGIFKDLCEREKSLSKYVTISEEPVMERPTIKAEVVEDEKKTSSKNINEMDLEEINNRIKYIKKYLYEMTNLYKKDEYKNAKIIKIQGYMPGWLLEEETEFLCTISNEDMVNIKEKEIHLYDITPINYSYMSLEELYAEHDKIMTKEAENEQ